MRRLTLVDHRNGHHTGHDRSCLRCWLRAIVGRTPKPVGPAEPDYQASVVGPEDLLVLVARSVMSAEMVASIAARVPERWSGRLLVVDGDGFEAIILRSAASGGAPDA